MCRRLSLTLIVSLFALLQHAHAAVELVQNGGFESGDFTGWNVVNRIGGVGNWHVSKPGDATPDSNQPTSAVGASGKFYAVSDQPAPGTHSLLQTIAVPSPAASVILSFDLFVNDVSRKGPLVDPIGLDHGGMPNQHARVDILTSNAGPFDTGAGVLANFFLGIDLGTLPHDFTHYSFDITSLIGAGGVFQLRFAEVDNQGYFNAGVDNVSILYTPLDPAPEPASLAIWSLLSMLGLGHAAHLRPRR